jgi:esterase/lipase superfamily enzyme
MRKESRLARSEALGHDIESRVYTADRDANGFLLGQPIVAFPSMNGRVWDWEGWGMVDALAPFIESGQITLYCADSIDWQSWTNGGVAVEERAHRHQAYDKYLVEELLPVMRGETGREAVWATGCSMGAFHAANLFFRHPDVVDGVIAISGIYKPSRFLGEFSDDAVYFNSPLYYLPNMADPWYLERYRRARLVFVVGQGRWEEDMIADTQALESVLAEKGVPATFDYWGHDADHDWPWWRKMLPHHLGRLLTTTAPPAKADF